MMTIRSVLLATAILAPAAVMARPMTPEDVARLAYTGTIAVSADGSQIAYTSFSRPDVTRGEENGGGKQRLFLADAPLQARAYLPDDVGVAAIEFSPDGSMITYLWADEGEKRAVWGVPVGGGAPVKLAAVEDANVSAYAIAPDGASVVLLAGAAPDEDRKKEADLGFNAEVYEEEQHFNRVFVATLGMEEIDGEPRELELPGHVDEIDLAPDGSFLVVTSSPTTLVDDNLISRKPYIVDLATGETRVVDTPGKIGDIEISPDGTQLSMMAGIDVNDPDATTLHLVNVATAEYVPLNGGAAEAATDAEWMADGRLAVLVDVGAQSLLRLYAANGKKLRDVDPEGLILTSIEQGGNRIAVEANSPKHPNELFLFDGSGFTRWTDHNPWLAEVDLGVQRTITYTARDGQEIEGILIEPVDGIPFERAPTIFYVHGGPESHESNGWATYYSMPGQLAAGRGYAVFMPNYRGSTGYGVDFAKQHQNDASGREFDDLVDAKYALAEMGITDPARVGVTGGSYGGYATAWASTRYSEEFAAGVMFVGISNVLSKWGTTDIPTEEYNVHARVYPWEDYLDTLQRSPVFYADQADTPLLIMHGDSDTRVSPTQSMELYRHIKVRRPDTPLRLVFYPGEGHGNAQAAARYDYNLRMMEWFDTYLMTGDRDAPIPGPRPDLGLDDEEGSEE